MKLVRMLGLCAVAMLGVAAFASSPALAVVPLEPCGHNKFEYGIEGSVECESEKERAEFEAFTACPLKVDQGACVWAQSQYKEHFKSTTEREEWEKEHGRPAPNLTAHFTAGKVTVNLKSTILLQGGLTENSAGTLEWLASEGQPTIEPVQQTGPALPKFVDTSKLSAAELMRYNYFVKSAKETQTYATVELAGPASGIQVNLGNLLAEEGVAFVFPVKVKLTNNFLGSNCYVGSDANPIVTEFSTGVSGALDGKTGKLTFNGAGTLLTVNNNTIVSNTFAVPGVEGCGVEGGADEALNSGLGLPAAAGANSAVLNGTLKQVGAEFLRGVHEHNELHGV